MFARWKSLKGVRGWHVWKLKLIDARLYFVSIFVGLLTGLVAVPYHYLLQFFFDTRRTFFDAHPRWYWHCGVFLFLSPGWSAKCRLLPGEVFRRHAE